MNKVLFICKQRPARYGASYGLLNSCKFLCNALKSMGIDAKIVEVVDNNFINKEVHDYKPTHVFIEALWVVPEKFEVLIPLHPHVEWHVRLHSNTTFIANEGIAMEWIIKYAALQERFPQFHISPNSTHMVTDLWESLDIPTIYSPNIYQPHHSVDEVSHHAPYDKHPDILDLGCFGAIRSLKNHLIQAMAAMAFAKRLGKTLHFHINHSRIENKSENVYRNLVALFVGSKHKLIMHEWIPHHEFVNLVRRMDIGLQVSLSETFNIVSSDFVHSNVPIVVSNEIEWMNYLYKANPTDLDDIVCHLWMAWRGKSINLQSINKIGLNNYNTKSRKVWRDLLHID